MDRIEYNIFAQNLNMVQNKIKDMSKKATKLGFEPINYEIGEEFMDKDSPRLTITICPQIFKINGWEVVGIIDHDLSKSIVRCFPGKTVPEKFRTEASHCDHCNVNRMRRDTYIVQSNDVFKQIGRNCLKDFTGHDIRKILAYATIFEALNTDIEHAGNDNSFQNGLYLKRFMELCAHNIRQHGWLSSTKAREQETDYLSTASRALATYYDNYQITTSDADKALAESAMEWAKSFEMKENLTDWEHNVSIIVGSGYISHRHTRLAASILGAYISKDLKDNKAASEFVGTVGEKISGTYKIVLVKPMDMGGVLYSFEDQSGNKLSWFASKRQIIWKDGLGNVVERGETIVLNGRVKDHQMYNNVKTTYVTRCKLSEK